MIHPINLRLLPCLRFVVYGTILLFGVSCSNDSIDMSWMGDLSAIDNQVSSKPDRVQFEYSRLKKAVLSTGRNYSDNLRSLALFLHANGLYEAAIVVYEELVADDPEKAEWPYLYAIILLDYGMMDKALEMLDRSLALDATYPLSYLKKADLLSKNGQRKRAIETYKMCLHFDPLMAHASLALARIAIEDKDTEQGLKYLNDAVKQDPTLSSSHFLLATVYEQQELNEKAQIHRTLGTKLGRFREPADPWTEQVYEFCYDAYKLSVLADTMAKTRRLKQALIYFEKAHALDPADGSLCLTMAQAYLKHGNKEKGMRYLDEAIRLDPSNHNAYISKAAEYAVDEMNQAALNVLDQGIKAAGPTAFFYRQRGMLVGAMGDKVGMEMMFLKAVNLEPENVQCNVTLANHLWGKGAHKSAVYYYEQARRFSILEIKSRAVLASYYLEEGDIEAAGECLKEIENVDGGIEGLEDLKAAYLLKKGNAAFKKKEWGEAEMSYQTALELNPNSEEINNNWIKLLVETGRVDEALQKLEVWIEGAQTPKIHHYRLVVATCLEDGRMAQAEEWLKEGMKIAHSIGNTEAFKQFSHQLQLVEKSDNF